MSETLDTVVTELRRLKDQKERLNDELTETNKKITHIEQAKLPSMMETAGITSFKVAGIGTVSVKNETFTYVPADNRENLYAALREQGHGDLISETVHPSTLNSFVKECLAAGMEVPDEIKVTYAKVAKLRRS